MLNVCVTHIHLIVIPSDDYIIWPSFCVGQNKLHLYINLACLSVCLSVCLYPINVKTATDRAQILCGTLRDPWEGLWMIKFSKICLHQNSIFLNFKKLRNFIYKIREIFSSLFLNVYNENIFTI